MCVMKWIILEKNKSYRGVQSAFEKSATCLFFPLVQCFVFKEVSKCNLAYKRAWSRCCSVCDPD